MMFLCGRPEITCCELRLSKPSLNPSLVKAALLCILCMLSLAESIFKTQLLSIQVQTRAMLYPSREKISFDFWTFFFLSWVRWGVWILSSYSGHHRPRWHLAADCCIWECRSRQCCFGSWWTGPVSWSLLSVEGTQSLVTGFLEISFAILCPCACSPTPAVFTRASCSIEQ